MSKTASPPSHGIQNAADYVSGTYDAVADEYYDSRAHPTCNNLNRLSHIWLSHTIPRAVDPAASLEVGAGNSILADVMHSRGQRLDGLMLQDASAAMLKHSHRWSEYGARAVVADACAMERREASVDLLVASLADPYNTTAFFAEASRVLRPGGQILLTLPSFEWAVRFRDAASGKAAVSARFVLYSGRALDLPSFVRPLDAQVEMIERAGLMLTKFDSFGVDALPEGDFVSPKTDVFGEDPTSLLWGFRAVRLRRPLTRSFSHVPQSE